MDWTAGYLKRARRGTAREAWIPLVGAESQGSLNEILKAVNNSEVRSRREGYRSRLPRSCLKLEVSRRVVRLWSLRIFVDSTTVGLY